MKKYIIDPSKYSYDPKLLNEYNKVSDTLYKYLSTMPDQYWRADDTETLANAIEHLIYLAKQLKGVKPREWRRGFQLSFDKMEQFIQVNALIERAQMLFPSRNSQLGDLIIHKLNVQKMISLQKK